MERSKHWAEVWNTRDPRKVSWFESRPETSLDLVKELAAGTGEAVLDVGGGASALVDGLLEAGFTDLGVLDVAASALVHSQERLGPDRDRVQWYAEDVTAWEPPRQWDIWHDRAVLHFLTEDADVEAYRSTLEAATAPGSRVIIGTFALGGPRKCSGLWIRQYGPEELVAALGSAFHLERSFTRIHQTPNEVDQSFHWGVLRRV